MDFASIGLILIVLAWAVQLIYSWKGKKDINKYFLVIYAVGVLALVLDDYVSGFTGWATFNLVSLILSIIVLINISYRKAGAVRIVKKKKR